MYIRPDPTVTTIMELHDTIGEDLVPSINCSPADGDVYEAWNRGVNAAHGKYVVNANTDDGHRKDAFESLAQCLEANPKASIAYGDIVYTTKANDTFPSEHVTRQIHYPEFHPGLAFACCFAGCTQFWRRDDLIRVGIFDASYKAAGDYEILLRAVQHGLSAVHIP